MAAAGAIAMGRPASDADAVRGVHPRAVAEPASAEEAAAILRAADAERLAVIPRGGGTKLGWGNPPRRADLVLSLARLSSVVEHAWADLTVTVEAGCTMQALQDAVGRHGQRVAADPLWPQQATVGGVLSCNDTGVLRLRFGGWRDLVIGTTLALPDGTLARSGGKVVKNVAGYDLSKLATGALGTLGVITTAVFRLHPLPRVARTLTVSPCPLPRAQQLMAAVQDSRLAHTALQVRTRGARDAAVDVLIEGSAPGVDAQVRDLRALVPDARWDETSASVWHAREALWQEPGALLKVSVPLTAVSSALEQVERMAQGAGGESHGVFQATGLGWIRVPAASEESALVSNIRGFVDPVGGSAVVLRHAPDDARCDTWGPAGDALPLMQAIKQQFDPHGTLNPGRFLGGL